MAESVPIPNPYLFCANCDSYISCSAYVYFTENMRALIGVDGSVAELLMKTENLVFTEETWRQGFMTRVAVCKTCGLEVGWRFEYSENSPRKWLVGFVVIESINTYFSENIFDPRG